SGGRPEVTITWRRIATPVAEYFLQLLPCGFLLIGIYGTYARSDGFRNLRHEFLDRFPRLRPHSRRVSAKIPHKRDSKGVECPVSHRNCKRRDTGRLDPAIDGFVVRTEMLEMRP